MKNSPTIFSRFVVATLKDFVYKFLDIYLFDWRVSTLLNKHIEVIHLILDRYRQPQVSLNFNKCIFFSQFGIILGHVVYKQGLLVDHAKNAIRVDLPQPTSVQQLFTTLGHTWYYKKLFRRHVKIIMLHRIVLEK